MGAHPIFSYKGIGDHNFQLRVKEYFDFVILNLKYNV